MFSLFQLGKTLFIFLPKKSALGFISFFSSLFISAITFITSFCPLFLASDIAPIQKYLGISLVDYVCLFFLSNKTPRIMHLPLKHYFGNILHYFDMFIFMFVLLIKKLELLGSALLSESRCYLREYVVNSLYFTFHYGLNNL